MKAEYIDIDMVPNTFKQRSGVVEAARNMIRNKREAMVFRCDNEKETRSTYGSLSSWKSRTKVNVSIRRSGLNVYVINKGVLNEN